MENNKAVGLPTNEKESNRAKKFGMVSNCRNLRVRKTPDKKSDVIAYLSAGTTVEIDDVKTVADFYKVRVSDTVEGYCMRNFIEIQ